VKLAHLVGFIIRKFVTMHGHMNVKTSIFVSVEWLSLIPWFILDFDTVC